MDEFLLNKENELSKFIKELFSSHGIPCELDNNTILFPQHYIIASCNLQDKSSQASYSVIQLNIKFSIGLGKNLIESFAGLGDDKEKAYKDALENFTRNSFHVILSAFFTSEYDKEVIKEEWFVSNKKFTCISSYLGIRGKNTENISTPWIQQFNKALKTENLTLENHWIRFFYASNNDEITTCEILLNNKVWDYLQKKAISFDLQKSTDFTSFRLFYILQTPYDISRLASIMIEFYKDPAYENDETGNVTKEKIASIFKSMGLTSEEADRALIMIPEAFAQVFIEPIAPNFANNTEGTIFNKDKEKFQINLMDDYFYSSSYHLAKKVIDNHLVDSDSLLPLLYRSSKFNVFNQALNEDSKPEDLEFSGIFAFIADYNNDSKLIDKSNKQTSKKPFWKFW